MIYSEFIAKYPDFSSLSQELFNSWLPVAEKQANIFPEEYRQLATELYMCYLTCPLLTERSPAEVKKFTVQKEGYSVEYSGNNNNDYCARYWQQIKQLADLLGVAIASHTSISCYSDRKEIFNYYF